MSSSSQSQYKIPGITENSSIAEMMAFLRTSSREEDIDEVARLVTLKETNMENKIRDLQAKTTLVKQRIKENEEAKINVLEKAVKALENIIMYENIIMAKKNPDM